MVAGAMRRRIAGSWSRWRRSPRASTRAGGSTPARVGSAISSTRRSRAPTARAGASPSLPPPGSSPMRAPSSSTSATTSASPTARPCGRPTCARPTPRCSIRRSPRRGAGRWERGDRLVLAPNPRWPGGRPRVAPIVVRIVPDAITRVLELARGDLDLAEEPLPPELLAWLARQPAVRVLRGPGTSFAYLALNLRDPRLADRRVREAIALALDRDALVHRVLGGTARPATGLLAPEHWAYAPVRPWRHDPWRARRLLDRAGYPAHPGSGMRFRLLYKTSADPERRRLAEAIQADLAAVGIALDVRSYEWGTLFADIRAGRFEVAALAWVGVG